jgi:hypothetical protein
MPINWEADFLVKNLYLCANNTGFTPALLLIAKMNGVFGKRNYCRKQGAESAHRQRSSPHDVLIKHRLPI